MRTSGRLPSRQGPTYHGTCGIPLPAGAPPTGQSRPLSLAMASHLPNDDTLAGTIRACFPELGTEEVADARAAFCALAALILEAVLREQGEGGATEAPPDQG